MNIPGRRKAAVLLVSLGQDAAAQVFRHLPDDVIERLTIEMAMTPNVDAGQADAILREALDTAYQRGYVKEGGLQFARGVLEQAMGVQRATDIMHRLTTVIEQTPFDFLRAMMPGQIVTFLRNEHPQTIALVVSNIPTQVLAAEVMQELPAKVQADVAYRIATMEQTPPDVVREIATIVESKLDDVFQHEYASSGGAPALAQILNSADRTTERNILDHLSALDSELAERIRSLLFVFEDIMRLDDRSIQLILKDVDQKNLALALRGARNDVKERIFANMSERASEMLKEEMEFMPPQRRKVVEEAQSSIVAIVRKLEDEGTIIIARGGGGDDEVL